MEQSTWSGVLPDLLDAMRNGDTLADQELQRMAQIADTYIEQSATRVPVKRFWGDKVAEREAEARSKARAELGPRIVGAEEVPA